MVERETLVVQERAKLYLRREENMSLLRIITEIEMIREEIEDSEVLPEMVDSGNFYFFSLLSQS